MKLTKKELETLYFMTRSMIEWDLGSCFADGEQITDKKGLAIAKRLLGKISIELKK